MALPVPPAVKPGANSEEVQVGIEEELSLVGAQARRDTPQPVLPGVTLADTRPLLPLLSRLGLKNRADMVGEASLTTVERNSKPMLPSEITQRLQTFSGIGANTLRDAGYVLAPLPVPLMATIEQATPGGLMFRPNPHPKYAHSFEVLHGNSEYNTLAVCAMHAHVSQHGRFTDSEALRITRRIRPFLPWLLSLAAASPINPHGYFEEVASTRFMMWSGLSSAYYKEFGNERFDFNDLVDRFLVRSGLDTDIYDKQGAARDEARREGARRMFSPARPNFELGTVEVRVCDVQASLTSTRFLLQAIAGLVQTVNRGDIDLISIDGEDLKQELRTAAKFGMYRPDGKMIDPTTGHVVPTAIVNRRILELIAPALIDQGTYERTLNDFAAISQFGTGAARQFQDAANMHHLMQRMGHPESNYNFDGFIRGQVALPLIERRGVQLLTARCARHELSAESEQVRRNEAEQIAEALVLTPARYVPQTYRDQDRSFEGLAGGELSL